MAIDCSSDSVVSKISNPLEVSTFFLWHHMHDDNGKLCFSNEESDEFLVAVRTFSVTNLTITFIAGFTEDSLPVLFGMISGALADESHRGHLGCSRLPKDRNQKGRREVDTISGSAIGVLV